MGNCESRELVAQAKQNKIINTELDKAKKTDENIIKLLLLGKLDSEPKTAFCNTCWYIQIALIFH